MNSNNKIVEQLSYLFGGILGDYYSYYDLEAVDVECTLSAKLSETVKEKRPDFFEGDKKVSPEAIDINRGTIIPPTDITGKFTIVIDSNFFLDSIHKNDCQWIGTLTHELTHILDFIQYAKLHNMVNYDVIQRDIEHIPFMLWTECNARAKGYFFQRKNIFEDLYDKEQTNYIIETELPFHINEFATSYSNAGNDAYQQMYTATRFLGSYSVWEELFPDVFTKDVRKQVLGINKWVLELYLFFISNRELERANGKWENMLNILRTNFGGFDEQTIV